jgi:hypothetical protein
LRAATAGRSGDALIGGKPLILLDMGVALGGFPAAVRICIGAAASFFRGDWLRSVAVDSVSAKPPTS